jgi:outer membrane immunogenic protein
MYRKFLLASAGAVALTGSAAFAADLPSRAPPPVYLPPPPIFTWTGIYIGGQIGYAWGTGSNNFNEFDPFTGTAFATSAGGTPNGVIGGAHVGYQYQFNQLVLGLEGTVDGTSLRNNAVASLPFFGGRFNVNASTNADVQGSIRGRLGVAWDRALIYATGGVAFGGFNTNFSVNGNAADGTPFFASNSFSNTRVGWTVGGGIDYAVTNNWSIFAEYRYTNFGSIRNDLFPGLANFDGFLGGRLNGGREIRQNQVQVGFSYKFDLLPPPPPIVAKY